MKDPTGSIRTWLFGVLNGQVSYLTVPVPVYSLVPKDTTGNYIYIGQIIAGAENDESTKDAWINKYTVSIEIYSVQEVNNATYVPVDTIGSAVLQLIRTRTAATISGYTVISRVLDSIVTDIMDFETKIVAIKIINLTLTIEEV